MHVKTHMHSLSKQKRAHTHTHPHTYTHKPQIPFLHTPTHKSPPSPLNFPPETDCRCQAHLGVPAGLSLGLVPFRRLLTRSPDCFVFLWQLLSSSSCSGGKKKEREEEDFRDYFFEESNRATRLRFTLYLCRFSNVFAYKISSFATKNMLQIWVYSIS